MEIPVFVSQRFQRPAGSCADADDPPACAFGFVDDIRGFPGDHAEFGVHMMLRDFRSLDGTERAEADVQRDIRFLNALGGELVQQLLRKVQTGCRCGGRAVDFGIDGLVAFAVLQFFLDVRRQRHFSEKGHVKALKKIEDKSGLSIYNLGTGVGYSVLDVVKNFEEATGVKIPYVIKDHRPGDIATCYADASKAERELGWKAEYGIKEMCADSWRWQSNNPNGYED